MSISETRNIFLRVLDKLPYVVAAGLAVSAFVFATVMVVTSLHEDVEYSFQNDAERSAVVSAAPVTEDSVLAIPVTVGKPWDKHIVRRIDNHSFEGDERFNKLILPEGLHTIGYGTFYGCKKLRRLVIPESVYEINDGAFYGCTSLKEVNLPSKATSYGEFIFERCTGLEHVKVPEGMTVIPRSMFCACTAIEGIKLPSTIVSIEPLAFKDCTSLVEIVLPKGLHDIGGCAFEKCTSLRRVIIPPHINGLGVTAFNGCTSLREIVSEATVPPPLGSSVFDGICGGATLYVPMESIEAYRASAWGEYFTDIREIDK